MAKRSQGKDKKIYKPRPTTSTLTPEDRLRAFANLIIDRILEEQKNGSLDQLIEAWKIKNG